MTISASEIAALREILPPSQILDPSSPTYYEHSRPWSLTYDKQPSYVLIPTSTVQLRNIVKVVYDSNIDFAIRGCGVGNSSASDIIINMSGFTQVTWNDKDKTVDIGAGLDWGTVDEALLAQAPGYVVVGSRCPFVGVVGSTLTGGLSWLSHELGLGSDPSNLLDARIVTFDGRDTWASSEPELLWALRGGGGNFGVVTTLRLRAQQYTTKIFAGLVFFPSNALHTLSKVLSTWSSSPDHQTPNLALHVFIVDFTSHGLHGAPSEPQLVAIVYDSLGEKHGRSDAGFKAFFDIEDTKDTCREIPLNAVHDLQAEMKANHGTAHSFLEAALIGDDVLADEKLLVRGWEWYMNVVREEPELQMGTFVLIEVMQEPSFSSTPSRSATAWPHGHGHAPNRRQHVLQLSTGSSSSISPTKLATLKTKALDLLAKAPAIITNKQTHPPGDFLPNFLLENHDVEAVFGENWERLRRVKGVYDAKGRFDKGFFVPPLV